MFGSSGENTVHSNYFQQLAREFSLIFLRSFDIIDNNFKFGEDSYNLVSSVFSNEELTKVFWVLRTEVISFLEYMSDKKQIQLYVESTLRYNISKNSIKGKLEPQKTLLHQISRGVGNEYVTISSDQTLKTPENLVVTFFILLFNIKPKDYLFPKMLNSLSTKSQSGLKKLQRLIDPIILDLENELDLDRILKYTYILKRSPKRVVSQISNLVIKYFKIYEQITNFTLSPFIHKIISPNKLDDTFELASLNLILNQFTKFSSMDYTIDPLEFLREQNIKIITPIGKFIISYDHGMNTRMSDRLKVLNILGSSPRPDIRIDYYVDNKIESRMVIECKYSSNRDYIRTGIQETIGYMKSQHDAEMNVYGLIISLPHDQNLDNWQVMGNIRHTQLDDDLWIAQFPLSFEKEIEGNLNFGFISDIFSLNYVKDKRGQL